MTVDIDRRVGLADLHSPLTRCYDILGVDRDPRLTHFIGVTAVGSDVLDEAANIAVGRLRAEVYIDREGFLPDKHKRADGTEWDEDDVRSIQVGLRRIGAHALEDAMLGCFRLIIKANEGADLPAEKMFPEIARAPVGSAEVSRFIARYPQDRGYEARLSLALMRAVALLGVALRIPTMYTVVERPLLRRFQLVGLPLTQISDPRILTEYKTPKQNLAAEIIPEQIIPALEQRQPANASFFKSAQAQNGIGSFNLEM